MRKYALTALCLLACASIITASTITQKVDATSRNIAPIDRIKVMTDSLYDLTNTDVPALISNLNAAGDGTAGLLQSVTPSTGTFTVNTNLDVTGDASAATLGVVGAATFNHSIVAVSTNDANTNTIVTVDAEVDPAYIEDAALDVAAITCDSVDSAGAIIGTTLNASGDAEFAADVHVASGAATQQWDNGSALIDTGALEDGPIDVAAVTCDSVAASGIITAANLTTTTDTIAGDLNITSNLVVSGTSTTLVFGAGSDIDMITDAGTVTNTIASNGVLAGGHMSGDIAVARISDALTAPGTIGSVTPAAGAFTTLGSSGEASMAGGQAILKDGSLASAQTATNNAPILLAGTIVQLDATGSVTAYTNTVTLTSLGTGTNGVFYVINTGTSNLLAIAQTGTWKSPAVELGTNEAMTVIGIAGAFYGIE